MKEVLSLENMKISDKLVCDRIGELNLINVVGYAIANNYNFTGNVLFICGKGNNGADGVSCANILSSKGINTDIVLLYKNNKDTINELLKYSSFKYYDENIDFSKYDIIVDCIYGVGFKGELDNYINNVINKINNSGKFIISIDINSGLNTQNGICKNAIKSNITMSVGQFKPGHYLNSAKDYIDKLINLNVGINPIFKPYYLIEEKDLYGILPVRKNYSNKYNYGVTCIIGGCTNYSGAIKLTALANSACKSGIGICKICIPKNIIDYVAPYVLESVISPLTILNNEYYFNSNEIDELFKKTSTIVLGMGLSKTSQTIKLVNYIIQNFTGNLIIDADGLNCLSCIGVEILQKKKCNIIITPHLMEFSRLISKPINEIQENPIDEVIKFSKKYNIITLLKGPTTIISDGDSVYLLNIGCSGMATAGSGDVLSGILSSICTSSDNLIKKVCLGCYINGKAGELAQKKFGYTSMTASDTISQIPYVIKDLESKKYPN